MSEVEWPWRYVPPLPERFAILHGRRERLGPDVRQESRRHMARELAGECEAFLTGTYAERAVQRGGDPPVWAWTNLLAHGGETQLVDEARGHAKDVLPSRRWREARAYLATELLARARRGTSIARLQREVLVPLELQLASRPGVQCWQPQEWVTAVLAALDEHRQAHRR
jgi:hypothetical protein